MTRSDSSDANGMARICPLGELSARQKRIQSGLSAP
jgi:hypothetical protein